LTVLVKIIKITILMILASTVPLIPKTSQSQNHHFMMILTNFTIFEKIEKFDLYTPFPHISPAIKSSCMTN